jgi:hypothetical protein
VKPSSYENFGEGAHAHIYIFLKLMAEGVGVEAERRGEKIHRVTSPN